MKSLRNSKSKSHSIASAVRIPVAVAILVVFSIGISFAADVSKVGTTAATFLEIGIGARATAMGEAFTAVADDASAIYWNPAGMAWMEQGEAGFVHSEWLADISFDHVSGVVPIGIGTMVGAYVSSVSMDEMKVRTIEYPDGTGEYFESSDLALGVGFATRLTDRLSVGCVGKYIHQKIWHMSASSVAADLGLLFKTPFNGLMLGMSVSNFGPDMQMQGRDTDFLHDIDPNNPGNSENVPATLETEKWSLPLTFRVGVSMDVLQGVNGNLKLAADAIHPNDNYEYVNLGAEYSWRNWVFLRTGWKTLFLEETEQGFTAGGGVRYNLTGNVAFVADIAYADFGRLENVFRYSLGVRF